MFSVSPTQIGKTGMTVVRIIKVFVIAVAVLLVTEGTPSWAQETGVIQGTVTLSETGEGVSGAVVLIINTGSVTLTDGQGNFKIEGLAEGTYEVMAQREHLSTSHQVITINGEQTGVVNFVLELSPIHEEITVTATPGRISTGFDAFNATTTLDSFDLIAEAVGTIGEALEDQAGIAKRGFGPGANRPIIRGFDGDRVLTMEDGIRMGDLGSQSGDHGLTTDPNGLARIEIVRGPATLLYGSNAIGGVINAITPHENFKDSLTPGTRGQFNVDGGNANNQIGAFTSMQHTEGNIQFWVGGGSRRTDDYYTPAGNVENSGTQLATGRAGVGFSGKQLFASSGFTFEGSRYGIPFASEFHSPHNDHEEESNGHHEEETLEDIVSSRSVGRFDIGMRNLETAVIDSFKITLNLVDWEHKELEVTDNIETIGTTFSNRTYVVRADFDQSPNENLSGKFGVWSQLRNYDVTGEEALSPATQQVSFAAFAYEELTFGKHRVQLGGRLEHNSYSPAPREGDDHDHEGAQCPCLSLSDIEENLLTLEPAPVLDRNFIGGSASIGFRTTLTAKDAFVLNFTSSHRAPSLEELYNFGAHVGNMVFEIGSPTLKSETSLGLDMSIRHQSDRFRGSFNAYLYEIGRFVFMDVQEATIGNLNVAEIKQGDSRFTGLDAEGSIKIGSGIWANLDMGFVDAKLLSTDEPLPRIPPLQGSVSLNFPYRGLSITPKLRFASRQTKVFKKETETDGYTIIDVRGSYVWPRKNLVHAISLSGFNLTNKLYHNHSSFIKDLAPEIGRGVKMSYTLRFY